MPEIMKAARHKTEKNAMIYSRDAPALLQIARASGKLLFEIQWRSTYICDIQHARKLSSGYKGNLISASFYFVSNTLHIDKVCIY